MAARVASSRLGPGLDATCRDQRRVRPERPDDAALGVIRPGISHRRAGRGSLVDLGFGWKGFEPLTFSNTLNEVPAEKKKRRQLLERGRLR